MGSLKTVPRSLKISQNSFESLLNKYCLTKEEIHGYFQYVLFSLPVFIYFILKIFSFNNTSVLTTILGVYTISCAVYLFLTSSRFAEEKITTSVIIVLAYAYFSKFQAASLNSAVSLGILILVIYVGAVCFILQNRYFNLITYKDNPAGLVMFGKKYAITKFQSEFVASCIKVKENATRNTVKRDINKLYEQIKREMSASNINKSIAEYSEERIKGGKAISAATKATNEFDKGYVTIPGGIVLPIYEFNAGVPVVYIRGLDNHITKTLEFARKSKVGTDINGNNYIYPITPYLNRYEIQLFTDADNIVIGFKVESVRFLSKEKILKYIGVLDKVIDCYNDFYQKIKDTMDSINSDRSETEIEMELKHAIEQYSSVLNIYKAEAGRRANDKNYTANRQPIQNEKREGQEKRAPIRETENRNQEAAGRMVKSRQEVFAEGMDELENLIGLNSIKNEIKELVNKYRLDKYANQMGLPSAEMTNNFVFIGSPGVGKTTVARIMAKLLYGLEILRSFDVYEVHKSDFVGKVVGETEEKTKNILNEVIERGCLLLIEEFHQFYDPNNEKDYGREAIKVLMPALENHKDKFACIVTGYGEKISTAIKNSDPGLESRFSTYLYFENFKPEELVKIFEISFCGQRYNLNHDSRLALKRGLIHLVDAYPDFYNARDTRKIFEKAVKKQTSRLAGQQNGLSKDKLMLINKEDIDSAIQDYINEKNKMEDCMVD